MSILFIRKIKKKLPTERTLWLVARTEFRKEQWAKQNIENQGYEPYLPQYQEIITKSGRVRITTKTRLMFPGYIFCKTDGPWSFLTGTRGVTQLLMQGQKPGSVPDDVIEALKRQEDQNGFIVLPEKVQTQARPAKGTRVRLRSGPFLSYIGIYDGQTSTDFERVLLNCFGRQTVLQVRLTDIEEAEG